MIAKRIAFYIFIVLGIAVLSNSQDRRSGDFETLEGTWNIVTTPTGTQVLATYSRGGTLTADGNVASPGPCHGVWKRLSYLDFSSTCERFDFDAAGNWVGRTEYRQSIRVSSNLEEFSGRVQFRVFDRLDTPRTTGEGTLQGTRVNVKAIQ